MFQATSHTLLGPIVVPGEIWWMTCQKVWMIAQHNHTTCWWSTTKLKLDQQNELTSDIDPAFRPRNRMVPNNHLGRWKLVWKELVHRQTPRLTSWGCFNCFSLLTSVAQEKTSSWVEVVMKLLSSGRDTVDLSLRLMFLIIHDSKKNTKQTQEYHIFDGRIWLLFSFINYRQIKCLKPPIRKDGSLSFGCPRH